MAPFYTGADQNTYNAGYRFMPQQKYLQNPFLIPPNTQDPEMNPLINQGILATNAFNNSGGGRGDSGMNTMSIADRIAARPDLAGTGGFTNPGTGSYGPYTGQQFNFRDLLQFSPTYQALRWGSNAVRSFLQKRAAEKAERQKGFEDAAVEKRGFQKFTGGGYKQKDPGPTGPQPNIHAGEKSTTPSKSAVGPPGRNYFIGGLASLL